MSRFVFGLVVICAMAGVFSGCSDKERSYLEENTYSPNGDLKERRETRWRHERVEKEPRERVVRE